MSRLRRLTSSAACFTMRDSDRFNTLLCHDVDTRAAFARARFAYSLARSLLKFRPVVRTDSVSLGAGRGFAESTFMPLDFAIVPRWRRSVLVVSYALSNAILELHGGLSRGSLIRHKLLELPYRMASFGIPVDYETPDTVAARLWSMFICCSALVAPVQALMNTI